MISEPMLSDQNDSKVWARLNDIEELFASGKTDRARSGLLSVVDDISSSILPSHSAVLVRALRIADDIKIDDIQAIAMKVMEKCSLADSLPAMEAADLMITHGNTEVAKYILEKQNLVSNRALFEFLNGRIDLLEGRTDDAEDRFLRAYSIDPLFIRVYDLLGDLGDRQEWAVRKNIALLMTENSEERFERAFPNSEIETLHRIYWEWYKGDRSSSIRMSSISLDNDEGSDFKLAAARISMFLNDAENAVPLYQSVFEETGYLHAGLELAEAMRQNGMMFEALAVLGSIEHQDPLNRKLLECRIRIFSNLKKKHELKAAIERFLETEHADHPGYLMAASALSDCGEVQGASVLIDVVISKFPSDPDAYLLRSTNELITDKRTAALAAAEEAVRLAPKDPVCRYQRAKVLYASGKVKKAMRDIDASLNYGGSQVQPLVLLKDIYMDQKEYAKVLDVCRTILAIDPKDADVIKDRAQALDGLDRHEESLEEYKFALKVRINHDLFEEVLVLLMNSNRYDELLGLCKEFTDIYENNTVMWTLKGNIEYSRGEFENATASFTKACELSPYEPQIWHSRGMAMEQFGHLKKAEESYDKALLLDLDNSEYWMSKAVIQEKRKNLKGAVLALNRVIAESPESVFALVKKALILVKFEKYDESLYFLDLALKVNNRDTRIHEMKKDILKHISRTEQIIRASDEILLVEPNNREAHKDKINSLLSLGKAESALIASDSALRTFPKDMEIMLLKKSALDIIGGEERVDICNEILQEDPWNREIRMDLAEALADNGKTDEAMEIYDKLQSEDPTDMRVVVMKAKISSDRGEDDDAIALFQEAVDNRPDDAGTLNVLADVMIEQGYGDDAMKVIEKAIKLDPKDIRGYKNKAEIIMQADPDEAMNVLREALRISPRDPEVWKMLGQAQELKGDLHQSLLSYDSAMKMGMEDSEIYGMRGRVQDKLGMNEAAIHSYTLSALADKSSAEPLVSAAVIQMRIGRMEAATSNLDSALDIDNEHPEALLNRAKIHILENEEEKATKLYVRFKRSGILNDSVMRQFREMIGEPSDDDSRPREIDDIETYSRRILEYCYDTEYTVLDMEVHKELGIPENISRSVINYLGDIQEYGDIDTESKNFERMEYLSAELVLNKSIMNIDSEPLVTLPSAFSASSAEDVAEAKSLVAYIYKVMTEDIEEDVCPDDVAGMVHELTETAGDVTIYGIIDRFGVGVYRAKLTKIYSGKMSSDSISFHI